MNYSKYSTLLSGGLVIIIAFLAFSCSEAPDNKEKPFTKIAEATIPVTGMSCGSCEHHIETEVKRQAGIVEIDANHKDSSVYAKYDSSAISLNELIAAINETGYNAQKP